MFFHHHGLEEILYLSQPSRNAFVVTIPFKGFWWRYLDWQPFYNLALIEPEAKASLGFSWAINIPIKSVIFSKKFDMTLAS